MLEDQFRGGIAPNSWNEERFYAFLYFINGNQLYIRLRDLAVHAVGLDIGSIGLLPSELDTGRVHPWVGLCRIELGRVGSQNVPSLVGRVQCKQCLINMQFTCKNRLIVDCTS